MGEEKAVNEAHAMEISSIHKAASTELELELNEYRQALVREKLILGGKKMEANDECGEESEFAVAKRRAKMMARKKAEIEKHFEEEMEKLKSSDPKFAEKYAQITMDRDNKLAAMANTKKK